MKTRVALIGVILSCLLITLFVRRLAQRSSPVSLPMTEQSTPLTNRINSSPSLPLATVGQLRLSDDAASKVGDFWLEQTLQVSAEAIAPSNALLLDLYLSVDQKTLSLSGARARLRNNEISLEISSESTNAYPNPASKTLAKAEFPALTAGTHILGALWRRGELSIWLGSQQVLALSSAKKNHELNLSGVSGAVTHSDGLRLGARRAVPLNAIRFTDTFMRDAADSAWRPAAGRWELTSLAFPERSANPFSLRVSFKNEKLENDKLYHDRLRHETYGLGFEISSHEGTLNIARISGGSPAARAGLAEQDIFLEINGVNVERCHPHAVYQMLTSGNNDEMRLRMLRPGEKKTREFKISQQMFRWGTPAEGALLPPQLPLLETGDNQAALIAAGEPGWSDYAAEVAVKPLGTGGMGLVVGMLSPRDYLVFRWRGPRERGDKIDAACDKLELARVAAGKETLLAEKIGGYRPNEFYRMGVDWDGDKIICLVDGNEIFKTSAPELKRGQFGLYALKGDPVFFDDVCVSSERQTLQSSWQPKSAINKIMSYEENMEVWANPALEWERDIKTGWATHRARFPGEQTVILKQPKFKALDILMREDSISAPRDAKCRTRFSIANGEARFQGEGITCQPLKLASKSPERIVLRDTGSQLEADIGDQRLIATRALSASNKSSLGDRIAIHGLQNLGDPSIVRVASSNTLEYTFNSSPTDWKVTSGRWGLLNKWICDPRWSWFGGRTKTVAAIWNKYIFSGDISVDGYVTLMMQKDEPPNERPGDYNLVICGDGVNLDSGYALIFGGDNNSWTRLYRKGKLVAESNREEHRVFSDRIRHPDKPELHQRWFHLKLEKIGNQISFYRDDVLAFTFADPEPLTEGRVGFWTLDNGFLLARARIAHSGARPAPFEIRQSALYEDARVINVYDGEVLTSVTGQRLPPPIRASLNSRPDAFQSTDADAFPFAEWKTLGEMPEAYRVVNGIGGGPFALQWRNLTIDPNTSIVRFAYRFEPGANVDLYLVDISYRLDHAADFNPRQNRLYRWRLTGPRESNEFAPLVSDAPEIKADGRWHTIQFDLQPSWQAFLKKRCCHESFGVLRVMIGNLDNTDYLLAGMNGNHAGAAYSISNIIVMTPEETNSRKSFSMPSERDKDKALTSEKSIAAPKIITHVDGAADIVPSNGALTLSDVTLFGDHRKTRLQESEDAPPWAPCGQKQSIQVVNVADGSFFGFRLKQLSFNLQRCPYLLIDYKIPFETPVNLHLTDQSGFMHALVLTDVGDARDQDSRNIVSHCGPPADFIADGVWRQTTVPLQRLLEANPRGQSLEFQNMSFHDNGWQGNRRGMEYWIHRIQPLPAGRTDVFKFTWLPNDGVVVDIADYASCIDQQAQTDPMGKQEIASGENLQAALNRRGAQLRDGWNYLHARVKNSNGIWSDASHTKFFLDNQPPKILRVEPSDGAATASQTLRIYVSDESGIDPQTLRALVNGKALIGSTPGMTFDYAKSVFTYNALSANAPWDDGDEVSVDIRQISDTLGNRLQTPYRFKFKVDRSLDRLGPPIARMRFVTDSQKSGQPRTMAMETSFGLDFEEHTGHVHAIRDCCMEWLNDPAQAAFGSRAVKFTVFDDAADVQIMLHKNPWRFNLLPMLQFDYKADPGFRVDLLAEVMGEWHSIQFTGDGAAPAGGKAIGAIESVVADGKWHHASVDLAALINAAKLNIEAPIVNKIILSAQNSGGCQRGATLILDNLDISLPFGGSFEWESAPDASGLAGYAFLLDQNPSTVPAQTITHIEPESACDNVCGVRYAHVRACDQAGNWGLTRHFRVDLGETKRQNARHRNNTFFWSQ